jgi:hypothetical protein
MAGLLIARSSRLVLRTPKNGRPPRVDEARRAQRPVVRGEVATYSHREERRMVEPLSARPPPESNADYPTRTTSFLW